MISYKFRKRLCIMSHDKGQRIDFLTESDSKKPLFSQNQELVMALCVAHRVKKSWAMFSNPSGNGLQFSRLRTAVLSATDFTSIGNVLESHAKSNLSNRPPSNRNLPRIAPDTLGVPRHWHRHRPTAALLAHSSHRTS